MARILVHQPLNISRALEEMLKEFAKEQEAKSGVHVEIESQLQCQPENEDNIQASNEINEADIPDMLIVHANHFSKLSKDYMEKYFLPLPGQFPLRPELETRFKDPEGYLHPFAVMPFAIFYNPSLMEERELPRLWKDLLDPCWKGKICMPDKHHMAPKAIRSYMQANYPERYPAFLKNLVYLGAPVNVVNAVDGGQYPLGITNISFARISHNKNIRMLWPEDGILCIPQVMAWSKKADENMLKFGDFLRSAKVQEYLALQTFVPVSTEVPVPQLIIEHDVNSLRKID